MSEHEQWLSVAVELAHAAGAELRERWATVHTVTSKGFRDIVTEADPAAEAIVLRGLREAFPDHTITSEEAGKDVGHDRVRWFVDPLDGTTNFSRNNPNFSVSMAALVEGVPTIGVVYDPLREHCFAAHRGSGATLNGEPIETSGCTEIETMVFSTDWPRDDARRRQHIALIKRMLIAGRTLRCLGSAALNMAYVAAGWFDLYVAPHLSAWDQAAAVLLVQEAGGATATLSGGPWTAESRDPLLASTPRLIANLRSLLNEEQI
jgi:myo-inositol-1(or 4)-monophosphatase